VALQRETLAHIRAVLGVVVDVKRRYRNSINERMDE